MADEDLPVTVGDSMAVWPEGAPEVIREAHHKAQRWAHVLPWQIDRLYAARQEAVESHSEVMRERFYPDEARWPFMRMDAEAHFALIAARQLLKALRAFDGRDRLPRGLSNAQLRDVRDALEHWDTPGGSRAAQRLAQRGADPAAHQWSMEGPGVLGNVVPDTMLRQWGIDVYADLNGWDPYDGWPS